jgi:D-alanyl-D-alanine carboxypeptidase
MIAFNKYLTNIVERAGHEAREDRSPTFEAQHLLLAVASEQEPTIEQLLAPAGLDYEAIRAMLDREFEESLRVVGVTVVASDLPRSSSSLKDPKPGTSARLAMERGFSSVAHKKDLRPAHLLLGILRASTGTVPRALAIAGINQADLEAQVVEALDAGKPARG